MKLQPILKKCGLPPFCSKKIWLIAWPMILANISVPLLGFVDTAVIGHLPEAGFLAGTALGSLVVTVLFWLLGFLRMSTTGLIAQASNNKEQQRAIIMQGMTWALLLSGLILALQQPVFRGVLLLVEQQDMQLALTSAQSYFDIRIWVTPFALINLVLAGYLIGLGKTKVVLNAVIGANILNLIADLLLVVVFNFGVEGVAFASVMAELFLFLVYFKAVFGELGFDTLKQKSLIKLEQRMLRLNSTLFLRSALLQLVLSFLTIYASRYGQTAVAANAILMQFFLFISFTMDGIAFALESLVGKAKGLKQTRRLKLIIATGMRLSLVLAAIYSLVYLFLNQSIIELLTNIEAIRRFLVDYQVWIVLLPFVSVVSFIMDGVFVGLSWSKEMMLSMLAAAVTFFVSFILVESWQNQGLWLAFCLFMFMRGAVQLIQYRQRSLTC